MNELPYDWDELVRLLREYGCIVSRATLGIHRRGGVTEVYNVEYRGQTHPLQVPPRSGNPTPTVVRSLCDNLGLSYAPFKLPTWT